MRHVNRNAAAVQSTQLLSRQEALAILERCDAKGVPIPFAVVFVTADESKGTGGDLIRYEKAVWHVPGGRVRRSALFRQAKAKPNRAERSAASRWCRKIRAVGSDQVRQLHLDLILEINGQPVR